MANRKTLLIFPLITQLIFSLFLPFFSEINWTGLGWIALFATLPAFLLAIICVRYQFHQRNLVQLAVFSGGLMFFYCLVLLPVVLEGESQLPLWEESLAMVFYALMFSLPAMLYAMVILRLFLPKPKA
ncbi:hypothetical protein GVX76_02260 [[Haemophilus] felis]|nr:hypothetical protein [[Haemophilus] felis]